MVSKEDINEATELYEKLVNDERFMWPGRRNDDAVNLCICCRVLQLGDADRWFLNYAENHRGQFTPKEIFKILEHIKRVMPYAEDWGPIGNEGDALRYTLH